MFRPWTLASATLALVGCSFDPTQKTIAPELAAELQTQLEATKSRPDDLEARLKLAAAQSKAGQVFQAADVLKEATERWPKDPRSYARLSEAYGTLGLFMRGFETLRKCLDQVPDDPDCSLGMALLIRTEGSEMAEREARRMLRKFLDKVQEHPRRAEAERVFAELDKRLGPDAPEPPPDAASSQPASGPSEGGVTAVDMIPGHGSQGGQEVGELNPFGQAFARAVEATRRNDAPAAEAAFRDALKVQPNDAGALAGLAETLMVQGKNDEAIEKARKAYEISPNEPQTRWTFGLVMTRTGKDPMAGIDAWRALARDTPEIAQQVGVTKILEQITAMGGVKPQK